MLGRYHVLDEIGRNAVGPLYLARLEGPKGFQRWAAIRRVDKKHLAEEGYVQRFFERVREGAKLLHPNVTALFDVGEEDGTPWVAMEYLNGERIETAIERLEFADTPASWEIAARIIADAAEGVHAVHQLRDRELMHGDLASHSLVVTYEGKTKIKGAFEPRVHGVLDPRKIPYAAPEQLFDGSVDARADVFALGVLLGELLAGKRLFARATEDETRAMIEAGVVPSLAGIVEDLPRELDALVRRALMRSPASRFSSARELSRELESLLVQKGVVARDDDVGHYMRTLFADRYTDQEARLQAAADVTEIWRRSQQAPSARALAALPDFSAKDEEESEATELMRQPFGSDEDHTTAERPAAKVSGYTDEVAQADSGPTNPRIPPKPAAFHDTDEIPTMTAPQSTLAPKTKPLPKPLPKPPEHDRSDDDTQTAPKDPNASGTSRLIMPSSLISDPEVTESAIFVAPRIPVPTPPDTETSVMPTPPPRPLMPSFPDRPLLPSTPQAGVAAFERPRLNTWPPPPGTPPPLSTSPPAFTPPPAFPQTTSRGPHVALSTTSLRAVLFPQDRAKRIFIVSIVGLVGGAILFFVFLAVLHASDRTAQVPATASAATTKPTPSQAPSATASVTVTVSAPPRASASVAPAVPQIPTFDLTSPQPTRRPHTTGTTHVTAPPATTHEAPPPAAASGKTGFLTVICRPNACDHVLDGAHDLGDTPIFKHELTAGKHALTLRVDSTHASKVVTVDVPEGENVTIRPDTP